MLVTLLAVFVFARFYSGYGSGIAYIAPLNMIGEINVTWILLAVDGGIYVLYVLVK